MESVYFLVVGIVLYLVADRIVDGVERKLGRRLEARSLIFFGILIALALVTFALIRSTFGGSAA